MSWWLIGSYVLTFIAGVAAKSLSDVLTDRWRRSEQRRGVRNRFAKVEAAMPALLDEIRTDLASDSLVREFVALPPGAVFNHPHDMTRFEYRTDVHPGLEGKIRILLNNGYITDVRVSNHPIYRMTEEFIELLHR
jgi:hypothetical protein